MKRRSKVSGQRLKAQRPKRQSSGTVASKPANRTTPSAASEQGEIARLTRELNEAREQQTAASEVLRVISSSSFDLQPVFATMLEKAVRICDATFGNIFRWDGEAFRSWRRTNTASLHEDRRLSPISSHPNKPFGRLVASEITWSTSPDLTAKSSTSGTRPIIRSPSNLGAYGRFLLFRC